MRKFDLVTVVAAVSAAIGLAGPASAQATKKMTYEQAYAACKEQIDTSSRASGASGTTWAPVACRNMASNSRRKRKSSRPRAHPSVQCLVCGQTLEGYDGKQFSKYFPLHRPRGRDGSVTPVTWARCSVGLDGLASPPPTGLWGVVVRGCGPLWLRGKWKPAASFPATGQLPAWGPLIIGRLLSHAQVATTARYAHLDNDPLRRGDRSRR